MKVKIILIALLLLLTLQSFGQIEMQRPKLEGIPVFSYDLVNVASNKPGLSRLNLYIEICYDELQFIREDDKYKAVYEMNATLNDISPVEECLGNFQKLYDQKDRQKLIKSHRDSTGTRFLNLLASIFSLGIKNLVTGYQTGGKHWGFWQSRGESFERDVAKQLDPEESSDVKPK